MLAGDWSMGANWEAGTSRGNGTMAIPCPHGGTVLLLGSGNCPGGQSRVGHLSLVKGMNLPAPCGWWGDQGHLPTGTWGQAGWVLSEV